MNSKKSDLILFEHLCEQCGRPCDGQDCPVLKECNFCTKCKAEIDAYHDAMFDDPTFVAELTNAFNNRDNIAEVWIDPK